MKVYEALAQAIALEKAAAMFALMGDGNMELLAHLAAATPINVVQARHENAAVAMADGSARASGTVGLASVTCGPGVTQIATSLTASTRHGTPLVVLAGDTPKSDAFHLQELDLGPLVRATGAAYHPLMSPDQASEILHQAFLQARMERRPVVIGLPIDFQQAEYPWEVNGPTSTDMIPPAPSGTPSPQDVNDLARAFQEAERSIILAGAGAIASDAIPVLERLGQATGSLLATTLRAKGAFRGRDYDVGIAGAFSTEAARELFVQADLVVGFGASMGYYTTEGGYLFPAARRIKVDLAPQPISEGIHTADTYVVGDARQVAHGVVQRLAGQAEGFRTEGARRRFPAPPVLDEPAVELAPGELDPRDVMTALSDVLPSDAFVVVGAGHFWHFPVQYLHGAGRWEHTYDFGVIGQGLPTALGIAEHYDGPVILIEGDGSLLMNIQELETARRHNIKLLVLAMNDGAYGSEVHKLDSKDMDGKLAIFGRPNLSRIAQSFGIDGHEVTDTGELADLVNRYLSEAETTLLDLPISTRVLSPQYRRLYLGQI